MYSDIFQRNETARAVKPGEPWKRGIVGEKLARRKRRCARPLVGMDATRDRGGVGGIGVYVCFSLLLSLSISLSASPSPSPKSEIGERVTGSLYAHAIGIDGDSLSRPFAFSIRKFRFPLGYDIDTGYLSAGGMRCSFAGVRREAPRENCSASGIQVGRPLLRGYFYLNASTPAYLCRYLK